jgi:predicted porin
VSLVGMSGSEDLGNGLKATFRVEWGWGIDGIGGASGGDTIYVRDSKVGLAGSWGEVFLGYWDSPFKMGTYGHHRNFGTLSYDFFGELNQGTMKSIMGSPGGNGWSGSIDSANGSSLSFAGANNHSFDMYLANTVAYWSPVVNDNLSFTIHYSANEGKTAIIDPKVLAGSILFDNGQFSAGYSFENRDDLFGLTSLGTAVGQAADVLGGGTQSDDQAQRIFGAFKFGDTTIQAMWENLEYAESGTVAAAVTKYDRDAFLLAIRHNFGQHSVRARYMEADDGDCTISAGTACTTTNQGAKQWALGYTYALSGRTQLVANYVTLDNDDNGRYGLNIGTSDPNANQSGPGTSTKSLMVGIQHGF